MARLARGAVLLLVMLLFAVRVPHAGAGERGPICRVPSVVDVMRHELRRRDPYVRIRPRLIAEFPSFAPNVVLCRVAAETLRYDASRSDGVPLRYTTLQEFRVRAVLNGYVVTVEP